MLDILNFLKPLSKLKKTYTDDAIFRLHHKFTVFILVIFSILLTSNQYFGDPITCDVDDLDYVKHINMFCWIHGTFTVKKHLADAKMPGLGNENDEGIWKNHSKFLDNFKYGPKDTILWQSYYQWVSLVFILQAVLFYAPWYFWKIWEGGRLRMLAKDTDIPYFCDLEETLCKQEEIVKFVTNGKGIHTFYALRYIFCESLNLINVCLQIYLMNLFLSGNFSYYGLAVATFQDKNPMGQVFPKFAKCTYIKYGATSTIENRDALCILPLNILNEKLFLILWFWFHFLAVLSILSLILRVCTFCSMKIRFYVIFKRGRRANKTKVSFVVNQLTYGQFFVVNHLGKIMNSLLYSDLLEAFYDYYETVDVCYSLIKI